MIRHLWNKGLKPIEKEGLDLIDTQEIYQLLRPINKLNQDIWIIRKLIIKSIKTIQIKIKHQLPKVHLKLRTIQCPG